MKIGYVGTNLTLDCISSSTFRLASFSNDRFKQTVESNLSCLEKTIEFNKDHGILFYRITSALVPFASHKINDYPWQNEFKEKFLKIGQMIKKHKIRVSMHPDQFTLINSIEDKIFENSVKELRYHAEILDLLDLDETNKIQIHVGGLYGNKSESLNRFIARYKRLDPKIQKRLVLENDDRMYSLEDCLEINKKTGMPIVLDVFHHQINGNGESIKTSLLKAIETWKEKDGLLMVDYSTQDPLRKLGAHNPELEKELFKKFLEDSAGAEFDIMLEIKSKEKAAIEALAILENLKYINP